MTRLLGDSRAGVEAWRDLVEDSAQEARLAGTHEPGQD